MALTQVPIELSSTPGIVDNSNATAITIDSSENVGIGTTSPAKTLQVSQGTNATATTIRIENTDTTIDAAQTANAIEFYTNDASTGGTGVTGKISHVAVNAGSTYALAFSSYNGSSLSEAMRIDTGGDLLVGKTATAISSEGIEARNNGLLVATRDSNQVAILNRKTTEGDILAFYKDSASIGSIGVKNSDLTVGTGDTGLRFTDSTNQIWAVDTTDGSSRDAAVDLGNSTVRFRDLYLSGGAYLGGTGSANYLDDYEEGTWTPTIGQGTIGSNYARYIKVGNIVKVSALISTFSDRTSTSAVAIGGIPFVSNGAAIAVGSTLSRYINAGTGGDPIAYTAVGNSVIHLYVMTKAANYVNVQHSHLSSSNALIYFDITYEV